MVKKKTQKKAATMATAVAPKKAKPKKASAKGERRRPLDIEKVRERMATHKPPQSWYDEDHTGLY